MRGRACHVRVRLFLFKNRVEIWQDAVERYPIPVMGHTGFAKFYQTGLFALLLAIFGLFLILPILLTVQGGFYIDGEVDFSYILAVFTDPIYRQGLINATLIAVFTTILSLIIAMPLAILTTRYKFPGKAIFSSLILVPLILPPFVGAIGLKAILGRFGALNELLYQTGLLHLLENMGLMENARAGIDWLGSYPFFGIVVMEALHLYPIAYLNISAAMANLDPSLNEAAENVGAGRFKRFWKVTFPLIMPGIFAGLTIVFIWSFTELGTPLMFDFGAVTPVQVFEGLKEVTSSPRPYALVIVMLVVSVIFYLIGKGLFGRQAYEMQSKASIASSVRPLGKIAGPAASLFCLFITALAILPHIGVILYSISGNGDWYMSILPRSFTTSHYASALSHPLTMSSIQNSLLWAIAATVLCVIMGVAIAYLNVRSKIPGAGILDTLAMLPLAVPGLVMAFGFVAMSLWLSDWLKGLSLGFEANDLGLQVVGSTPNPVLLLIIAYAIRRLPYVVRAATAGLQQTSGQLEEASLNLGASMPMTLRKVVLPLIAANLIAGGILAFSFAMLEVSDSLILAQKEAYFPITKAIFDFFGRLGDGPYIASAMGVWAMALLAVTLIGASVIMGKKLGAIFRV